MIQVENSQRLKKIVKINPYITNYADISYILFFSSFLFYFLITFNIFIIINSIIENRTIDYYIISGAVESANIQFMKYVFFNMISFLNNLNHLNDFNFLLPYKVFDFNFKFENHSLNLSYFAWIIIFLSAGISILINSFYIYQTYIQNILRHSKVVDRYVPLFFLLRFYKRNSNNYIDVRMIKELRDQRADKTILNILKQKLFNTNNEDYQIIELEKSFLNLYHYTRLQLVSKEELKRLRDIENEEIDIEENKKIKTKPKKENKNEKNTIQGNKKPKDSRREEPNQFG